jgi:4-hydroxy-tetrahydrodipicolinate reductase
MGATVCQAVASDPHLDLVGGVDPHHSGLELSRVANVPGVDVQVSGDPMSLLDDGVDVVVDFTEVTAARSNMEWAAEHGVHAVVGTSGFTEADHDGFREMFVKSNCVIAPNFAIGAVLMIRFAELAAPYFETAEIIELHHDAKVDAPSGTAIHTAERIAAASQEWATDPTTAVVFDGARGADGPAGIHIHSVRMRGMVAHQEVILGTSGQTLTLRHDSVDRTSFMPGVLLAVKSVAQHPGLTVGLDALLDL